MNIVNKHDIHNTTVSGNIQIDHPAGEKIQLMIGNVNCANDNYQSWFTKYNEHEKRGIEHMDCRQESEYKTVENKN